MTERAFVIGVAGVPGSGKTTLMHLLLRDYPQARPVYYDRFNPGKTDAEIYDWLVSGGDPNGLPLSALIGELTRQTQIDASGQHAPLVLFETAFGRAHKASGAFIDFLVWIDTPLDIALSRASSFFLERVQRDQAPNAAPESIVWLARYMRDYPMLRTMYLKATDHLSSAADLILDGTRPAEALAKTVKEAIAARIESAAR